MKRIAAILIILGILLAAGCGTTTDNQAKDMKKQLQNTMDKANAAFPYIVDWAAYKTGTEPARMLQTAKDLVKAYPSLKKYVNAQGLFDQANYDKVEKAINTENPKQ